MTKENITQRKKEDFIILKAKNAPLKNKPSESKMKTIIKDLDLSKDPIRCKDHYKKFKKPCFTLVFLSFIILSCLFCELWMPHNPLKMNLEYVYMPPSIEHIFGTDSMGRDLFSMIGYGGRISLFIGIVATLISSSIGIVYGTLNAFASEKIDRAMRRFIEIIMSMPSILIVVFLQGIFATNTPLSIAIVIGISRWMPIAQIVRSEVKKLKNMEYIMASKAMGSSFFRVLIKHLIPNFMPAIMFMIISEVGLSIGLESTLSFLGLGLPLETLSWGSLLSLAQKSVLQNHWWMIVIPGLFLVSTLCAMTRLGHAMQKGNNERCSHL